MIQKLHISGFKCFRDLDLPQLGRINLFVGKNNSGKSSILEAVELFASDTIQALFAASGRRGRGMPLDTHGLGGKRKPRLNMYRLAGLLTDLFHRDRLGWNKGVICMKSGESKSTLTMHLGPMVVDIVQRELSIFPSEAEIGHRIPPEFLAHMLGDEFSIRRGDNIVRLNASEDGFIRQIFQLDETYHGLTHPQSKPVRFVTARGLSSEQARGQWDRLSLEGKDEAVLDWMRLIEPELREIRFLREAGSTEQLYLRINGDTGFKPLFAYGDGLTRIFHLALAAADASNGILLIDEFENGLHWSVQKELWRVILEASQKFDIQVFATTHSRDCLQSLAEVQSEQLLGNPAAIYRLERTDDTIYAQILPVDAIQSAMEYAVEVR